jgi:hypothetical protein
MLESLNCLKGNKRCFGEVSKASVNYTVGCIVSSHFINLISWMIRQTAVDIVPAAQPQHVESDYQKPLNRPNGIQCLGRRLVDCWEKKKKKRVEATSLWKLLHVNGASNTYVVCHSR